MFLPPYRKAISAFLALEPCPAMCSAHNCRLVVTNHGVISVISALVNRKEGALLNRGSWNRITKKFCKISHSFIHACIGSSIQHIFVESPFSRHLSRPISK